MNLKKIIISGAPGTGKSSIIKELKTQGYYCFEEVWDKKYENPSNKYNIDDINTFSQNIFDKRLQQLEYKKTEKIKDNIIFYDRSIIDTIAYLKKYKKNINPNWVKKGLNKRYNQTIFLCPLWKKIYKQNNRRKETYEESLLIEKFLTSTYKEFLYKIQLIPKLDIINRVNYILNTI